jgi:hypothetical protein
MRLIAKFLNQMKTRHLWVMLLLIGLGSPVFGQKIAYTNLELVLAYLPETQTVGTAVTDLPTERIQKTVHQA